MTARELIQELQKILKTRKGCDYPVLIHDTGTGGEDLQSLAFVTLDEEALDSTGDALILTTDRACKTIVDWKAGLRPPPGRTAKL
jgi:hypothetical protein